MSCWKDGSPDAQLLVVGMAPGQEELQLDTPFIGPSGKLLWTLLKKAGIDRADCYILNVCAEWPEGKTGGPTQDQLERNWDAFDSAVSEFRGRVALVLGGDAFGRFTGLAGGIQGWGGYILDSASRIPIPRTCRVVTEYKANGKGHKKGDPRTVKVRTVAPPPPFEGIIIPALHPAGVLRTGLATAPILAAQCKKAARAVRGELRPYRTAWSSSAVVWSKPEAVAIDIETGGIEHGITRLGVANERDGWSIPWSTTARAALCSITAQGPLAIFHNGGFDIPRLEAAGVSFEKTPIFDTMLAAAMLQPDLPKGLNACGSLYLDVPRWKHLDADMPAFYNATDAIRTYELWQVEKQELERTGQLTLFTGTVMRALPTLIRMGTRGLPINTTRRDEWLAELSSDAQRLAAEWSNATDGTNPNSPHQIKQLFTRLGMRVPLNKDGGESTDQLALARLRAEYPEHAVLLDTLQQLKQRYKDMATYASVGVGGDGRVHPSFVPAYKDEDGLGKGLAGTWRITAKDPNLQNQPTRARRMYCPDPGHVFIGADYSQLEARILAALSGDDTLMEDCDAGIHVRNAERHRIDKVRAKNGFYGWGYLAGARTLQNTFAAKGFKLSLAECQALLDGFDAAYRDAAGFRHRLLAEAQARRYVQNPFGFRRYFPNAKWPAPAAMSTHIQSTGAFMMWRILPQLEAAAQSFSGELLLSVHDDVLLQVPAEHQEAGLRAVVDIMQQEFPEIRAGFRCPVTPKASSESWGEMEDVTLSTR